MSLAEWLRGQKGGGLRASRAFVSLLGFTAAIALTGCGDSSSGFRPLYGSALVNGAAVNEKLASVDIAPIPGRVGQRIRNELIFQVTGGGLPKPPEYRLDVAIRESVSSTLVNINGNAGSQIYGIEASFSLVRLSDKQVIAHGKSYGRAAFERVTSIFANVEARQDAENRAAESVGEELRTRLLALLSSNA